MKTHDSFCTADLIRKSATQSGTAHPMNTIIIIYNGAGGRVNSSHFRPLNCWNRLNIPSSQLDDVFFSFHVVKVAQKTEPKLQIPCLPYLWTSDKIFESPDSLGVTTFFRRLDAVSIYPCHLFFKA